MINLGHYLDGEEGKVFVKMYAGEAIGLSFPTDGNNHNETWTTVYDDGEIKINKHMSNGELISIEIDLHPDITRLETSIFPSREK